MHITTPDFSPGSFAATVLLAAVAATVSPLSAVELCSGVTRVSLSPRPGWVSSAVFVPSPRGGVLAVDTSLNRLVLYSADGKGRIIPEPEDQLPALLATAGDRVLLKLVGKEAVSMDRTLHDSRPHTILEKVQTPLGPLTAVYEWTGVGRSVLAVGLVLGKKLPDGFQTGLFRFSTDEGEKDAELLRRVSAWHYYVLGYQYLTSTPDGTGYFLDMDMDHGSSHLFVIQPGGPANELKNAVPPEVNNVPTIDSTMDGPKDAPPLFARLAREKMVTGIYGGPDRNVYLLGREPAPNGVNDWWIFRVSPSGVLLGKARLPTHEKHLSVVVAPDTFYLIERGDVYPQGTQQIDTMVTVYAPILEGAPLRGIDVCPGQK
jgi:hypothetical protein